MKSHRRRKVIDSQWVIKNLSRSYSLLVIIFAAVAIAALDFAAGLGTQSEKVAKHEEITPHASLQPVQNVLQQPAWAFFHPVWDAKDSWFSAGKEDKKISLTPQIDVESFVSDPDGRVEAEFKVSPGMKRRTMFWMEVYAKYSNRVKVIHDRNDPGIIYGYIDLRPLYRVLGPSGNVTARANSVERTILKEFKAKLIEAIGNDKPKLLTTAEREQIRSFLSQTGALSTAATANLIENVRSQTGQRDEFLQALFRSATLLPHIETVFKRKGLPVGLARIPFVESSFNVRAHSSVGAMGIWQFMPETAKQMIHADEEKHWSDPLKQTNSAARLFQIYRTLLPDWGMAITAYNSGVGRMKRLSQKYRVKNIEGIINLPEGSEGLGFAGQNFYAEVLAANLVEAYKEQIFSNLLPPSELAMVLKGIQPFPKDKCDL